MNMGYTKYTRELETLDKVSVYAMLDEGVRITTGYRFVIASAFMYYCQAIKNKSYYITYSTNIIP